MKVLTVSPNVCACVSACVHESVSTHVCVFEAVSMTRAQHLGPELKLLRSLYVIRGQWRTPKHAHISVCVCEKNLERHQETLTESRCRGTKE